MVKASIAMAWLLGFHEQKTGSSAGVPRLRRKGPHVGDLTV
jgi:hypothetical protein